MWTSLAPDVTYNDKECTASLSQNTSHFKLNKIVNLECGVKYSLNVLKCSFKVFKFNYPA